MATETLRPNAAGDVTNVLYQYPDNGAHWDKVDEASADEDATYVWGENCEGDYLNPADTEFTDLYNLPAHTGSGTINSVTLYMRARLAAGTGDAMGKIKTNGVIYDLPRFNQNETAYETLSKEYATNPQTGVAWTWAEVDALQIGCRIWSNLVGRIMRITQLYVVVDYTPAVAGRSFGFIIG